jgi:hypothetical protein
MPRPWPFCPTTGLHAGDLVTPQHDTSARLNDSRAQLNTVFDTYMTMHSCLTAKKIPGHHIGKLPKELPNSPIPEAIEYPSALPVSGEDPRPSENGQVFGNIGLLLADCHLDVADTALPISQDLEDPKPRSLPDCLKELRLCLVRCCHVLLPRI